MASLLVVGCSRFSQPSSTAQSSDTAEPSSAVETTVGPDEDDLLGGSGATSTVVASGSTLQFVPLNEVESPCPDGAFNDSGSCLVPGGESLSDEIIESAQALPGVDGRTWQVGLVLTEDGIGRFNQLAAACATTTEICTSQRIGIVVDQSLLSAPTVQAPNFERDAIQVSGNFTREEAVALASSLNG